MFKSSLISGLLLLAGMATADQNQGVSLRTAGAYKVYNDFGTTSAFSTYGWVDVIAKGIPSSVMIQTYLLAKNGSYINQNPITEFAAWDASKNAWHAEFFLQTYSVNDAGSAADKATFLLTGIYGTQQVPEADVSGEGEVNYRFHDIDNLLEAPQVAKPSSQM